MKKTITKLILTSCLCVMAWQAGATGQVRAEEQGQSVNQTEEIPLDEAHFPCKLFREEIAKAYDKDLSGGLSASEIENIQDLEIENNNWEEPYSIEGVEYLTNLQTFSFNGILPEKGTLRNNKKLKSVYFENGYSKCDGKEFGNMFFAENLEYFYLDEISGIKNLSINSPLEKLKGLQIRYCENLAKLNVTKVPNLQILRIRNTPIKTLDLSKNKKLEEVSVLFGDWYNHYNPSTKYWRYQERFFKNIKNECKIKFASGCNIRTLEFFAKEKELDITRLKKLKTICVPRSIKVKTTTKWYKKNKKNLKFFGDGVLQKNLKKYSKKQMTKLQAVKKGEKGSYYFDDLTHG